MSPWFIGIALLSYFGLLLGIGYVTGKKATSDGYFVGNRQSVWWLVALGMLSDSMSGVSFISVPGSVNSAHWTYMQVVLGYVLGYVVIAYVLLPLYYKTQLTSIYTYLGDRFSPLHQQTGSGFFVLSRLMGSAARLYLTAAILQRYLFEAMGIPFAVSVIIIILLILAYTYKGGIKTLVFTDALQSLFLIGGVFICLLGLLFATEWMDFWNKGVSDAPWKRIADSSLSTMFEWNPMAKNYFWKHFLGGAAMCIVMTGLDQNMMQKNLSCKSLGEAQKNMITTGAVIFLVNIVFLSLGVMMYVYIAKFQLAVPVLYGKPYPDGLLPMLALQSNVNLFGIPWLVPLAFVLGLSAATFSSADSVLTTLTTSIYFDFLGADKRHDWTEEKKNTMRKRLHLLFAGLLFLAILFFRWLNSSSLIDTVLMVASYTYGPLLGLFLVGMFTAWQPKGKWVVVWSIVAPLLVYLLKCTDASGVWAAGRKLAAFNPLEKLVFSLHPGGTPWFGDYIFGFEILIINGLLAALGYALISLRNR
jgi:SSS family transporter